MATSFRTDRAEYERLNEIFERVIALAPDDRAASLEKLCAGDPDLLAQARLILEKHNDQDSFLDHPALGVEFSLETSSANDQANEFIGREIAGCTITRLISAGGMGVVYEAQQHNPERRVAIKMMRAGLWSHGARDRFSHEVNALGRLRHPNVAQIHQSGLIEDGASLPYFVMEYIEDARSITQWAQERDLTAEAQLHVFLQACDAVQHGHQHGIIPRDLKPDNILIGSDGRVKVIDFGVAKATESDLAVTMNTSPGQLVGTLQY
ncbi:MAG: serine/threonine protein kinase, partial [Planctomycetes bacterium]|nr:serine/threonine protein kinase [Planctomycetota bacterium]